MSHSFGKPELILNCLPIHYFDRSVDVSSASAVSVNCPAIYGAVAYDHTISGKLYMVVYHQSIHCPRLKNRLMCPMQSRMEGVRINDIPKFLAEDPDEKTHAIIVNDPLNQNEHLIIQLVLKGVTSYFPSKKPRAREYEDQYIPHIGMTSKA